MSRKMATNPPEGVFRDNQGNTSYCTRFAIALAIRNGFLDKDFFPGKTLDFHQNAISQVLVNEHKVKREKLDLSKNVQNLRIMKENGLQNLMEHFTSFKTPRLRTFTP